MRIAWSFRREEPARAFADCLRGAWALLRKLGVVARKLTAKVRPGQVLRLSPSLTRSPLQRTTARNRYASQDDFRAAYLTASLGR